MTGFAKFKFSARLRQRRAGRSAAAARTSAGLLTIALVVSGCAKPPRDVEPNIPEARVYSGATCPQLVDARARVSRDLIFSGLRQEQNSRDDRTRIWGAPSFFGTVFEGSSELELARLKGELRAIQTEMLASNCDAVLK